MSLGEYIGSGSARTLRLRRFNGNSNDSSGNGGDGTSISGFGYADGLYGQCLDRTGSASNDRVAFADWGHDGLDSGYMYSMWYNTDTNPGTPQVAIGTDYFQIGVRAGPVAEVRDYSGSIEPVISFPITLNTWHRIMATYNGSTLVLYVDGESRGSSSLPSVANVSRGFHVGNYGVSGNFNYPFSGYIDETVVENRYWFAKEEKKQYTWAKGRYAAL